MACATVMEAYFGAVRLNHIHPAADLEAVHKTFFSCHEPAKDREFVFTRYAP
jgi:hypothetical protein